jgi:hypothetical protein
VHVVYHYPLSDVISFERLIDNNDNPLRVKVLAVACILYSLKAGIRSHNLFPPPMLAPLVAKEIEILMSKIC